MKFKGPPNRETVFKEKVETKLKDSHFVISKLTTYYEVIVIKLKQYGTNIKTDIYANGIQSPERNPHIYGQLTLNRVARPFEGERTVFSTLVL